MGSDSAFGEPNYVADLAATPEPAAPRNGMDWSGTTGTVGPEPAPALPDEVREAAEMLALTLKMREAKHACNDATCRNVERAGWNVLAALAARKGGE